MRGGGDGGGEYLDLKENALLQKKPTPNGNRGLWVYRQEIALLLMQKGGRRLEQLVWFSRLGDYPSLRKFTDFSLS